MPTESHPLAVCLKLVGIPISYFQTTTTVVLGLRYGVGPSVHPYLLAVVDATMPLPILIVYFH